MVNLAILVWGSGDSGTSDKARGWARSCSSLRKGVQQVLKQKKWQLLINDKWWCKKRYCVKGYGPWIKGPFFKLCLSCFSVNEAKLWISYYLIAILFSSGYREDDSQIFPPNFSLICLNVLGFNLKITFCIPYITNKWMSISS